ncbi:MAG: carbohydrate ABC transporter permease, partial [Gorillibacterium sp.]|nr:carbohydrate ABC transporter permease [Gorillibacterium sp.]
MGTLLKNRLKFNRWLFILFMLVIGLIMVVPFVFMLSASIKPTAEIFANPTQLIPAKIQTSNYETVFNHPFYFRWYLNSLFAVTTLILLRGCIVSIAAFAFAKLRFRGREIIFLVLLATMMIPGDLTIVSRFILYKSLHLIDTMWAIVLPAAFDVFFLFLLRQFFASLPDELIEAAKIDGCSYFRIYWRISLPLAVPPLLTM